METVLFWIIICLLLVFTAVVGIISIPLLKGGEAERSDRAVKPIKSVHKKVISAKDNEKIVTNGVLKRNNK